MKLYTYNGEGYRTEEEANAARDAHIQDMMRVADAQNADMASVGYDKDRYDALIASGGGLSQMTSKESDFIKSRYQPTQSSKYKNSVVDQYLASVGLPPSSELSKYRTKYQEYEGAGGIKETYGALDDKAWSKINELWSKDWQYGLTNEDARRQSLGLAPVSYDDMYEDTRLDEELKAAGLPPSKLLNGKLGEAYNEWAQNDSKRNSVNEQIAREYAKHLKDNDGTTLDDVISSVLTMPENIEFSNAHYGIYEDLPELESDKYKKTEKKNGVTFDIKDENGDIVYDEEKWRKDYLSASMKNSKINNDEFSITPDKIQEYWDKNAGYYNAERAALDYYAGKGITKPTDSMLLEKMNDIAIAQSINEGAGFTMQDLFGDTEMSEDELAKCQGILAKVNHKLQTEGYTAAYAYLSGGEFGADMRTIQEDMWVDEYKQKFADVPSAQEKTRDEILDLHYGRFKTRYGMSDDDVKKLRNGDITIPDYMGGKVTDLNSAKSFAADRHARELDAAGLPDTLEELIKERDKVKNEMMWAEINDDHGFHDTGYDDLKKRYDELDGNIKHWDDIETAYYLDAVQYTSDFAKKTADMANVDEKFSELVSKNNSVGTYLTDEHGFRDSAAEQEESSEILETLVAHATDDEKKALVYLGETGADVSSYLNNVLMRRWDSAEKSDQLDAMDWWGSDKYNGVVKALGGIAHTLAAVTVQPWEAVANLASDAAKMVAGKDIYTTGRHTWADDQISLIARNISADAGDGWATAYQLVPSMIQSTGGAVAAYFTGGATEALTLALMATQAYSSTVENALLNGANTKEAFWFGIASGAAEALFESASLEQLTSGMKGVADVLKNSASLSRKELVAQLFKTWIANSLMSGVTEASEEVFTTIANTAAEQYILGYDASSEQLRRKYLEAGMTTEQADEQVIKDNLTAIAMDAVGGFASGALMGFGTNLIVAGRGIALDRANIEAFTNSVTNLSGISYDDAMALAQDVAKFDTNNALTLDGAQSVIAALKEKGADAAMMQRVVNTITDTNTQNDVMTYLNTEIGEQLKTDKVTMVEAAERVIAAQNPYNLSSEYVAEFASQYINEITEAVSKGDAKHLEDVARAMQKGFVDETIRRSGNYLRAGMSAMTDYIATLDEANTKLVTDQAKKLRAAFAKAESKLTGDSIDNYAMFAAAMMHMTGSKVQSSDFVKSSTFMFGRSSTAIPAAIQNVCLNSNGAEARAFVDAALEGIALHQDSDSSMLMNQLSLGMTSSQYAISSLALASQRASGSMQRNVYDYIVKYGASESALNLLSATLKYESMNGNARKAATNYYESNASDAVMTADVSKSLAEEHQKLWQDYTDKRNNYELMQQRVGVAQVNADSKVARYEAEYEAFKTDTVIDENGNPIPAVPVELKETAERTNDALQRAIEAREKLAAENDGKLNDSKNEMDAAQEKLAKFEEEYNKKLNRQVVAYVKSLGHILAALVTKDAPSLSALDRATALFTYGTAQELNDIETKLVAAEKARTVYLGNALGITVNVAEFNDEFRKKYKIPKGEKGFEKDGKVFLNESIFKDNTGVRATVGSGTEYVLLHEFGHVVEMSAKQYSKYFKFAYNWMVEQHGKDFIDGWVKNIANRKYGGDEAKAQREVVAEFTRTALLKDPRFISALCDKAPVMSTRILQWLTNVNHNIFGDTMARSNTISKAQLWYAKALKAANLKAEPAPNQTNINNVKQAFAEANAIESLAAPKRAQAEAKAQAKAAETQSKSNEQEQKNNQRQEDYIPEAPPEEPTFGEPSSAAVDESSMNVADRLMIEYAKQLQERQRIEREAQEKAQREDFAETPEDVSAFTEIRPTDIAKNRTISEINDEYMQLARKYMDKTATREEVKRLRALVEAAAIQKGVITNAKGRPQNLYRGTTFFDGSGKNISLTDNTIFTTTDIDVASGYSRNRYDNDDSRVRQLRQQYIEDDGTDETLFENAKNILGIRLGVNSDGVYYDKITQEPYTREELVKDIERFKDRGIYHLYGFEGKQYRMNADGQVWNEIDNSEYGENADDIAENARRAGYTSTRIDNVYDGSASFNAGTDNLADDVVFSRLNDVKSADIVTLDNDGNIIPLTERFNQSVGDARYFTEFDAINKAINVMSEDEFVKYGSPHMFASSKGLLVRRLVSAEGYNTGDVTREGERNIALIADADKYMAGNTAVLHMPLTVDECVAVVIPSGNEYGDLRTVARQNGVNVFAYDDASQFDTAQERAAEKDDLSFFLDDDLTYEGFLQTYGLMPAGMNPRAENRPVPRRTARNNRVSRAYRTLMEATGTTEETVSSMKEWIVRNGVGTYMPQSNMKSLAKGRAEVDRQGSLKAAAAALHANVASDTGKNTDLVAQAEVILARMQNDDTMTDAEKQGVVSDLCILATDSGRASQLISAIKRMTPDGHIIYMEQVGKRMSSRYEKRTGKIADLKLTEEEKAAYRKAKTQEERDLIDDDVTKRFGEETSDLTWRERMRNWRYFAMLANARTHFRNITGNVLMYPNMRIKDFVNTAYQAIDVRRNSDKHPALTQADRTTTFVTKRADAQTREYVERLTKEAMPIMQGVSSKYIESINSAAKTKGEDPTFWQKAWADVDTAKLFNDSTKSSALNKIARGFNKLSSINSNMLELEDAAFLGLRFKSSVYQQLQAKGIDITKITDQQRNQVMNYAMEEALRATFRDASALADAINEFAKSGKAQVTIVEGLFPFKKTPINIAKRSIEYSPLGVIQGVYKMVSNNSSYKSQMDNINNSKLSAAEKQVRINELNESYVRERVAAIDRLAAGTTGSILTAIGIMAASFGWISVKRKDDEADTFDNGLGKNRYSLNIGKTSIDLSAFSPAAVPLIIGATIFEMTDGESDTDGTPLFSAIIGSLCEAIDPITEMSVISSFADAMGFTSYSNEEAQGTRTIFSFLGKGISSYIGQYVPTKVGQLERTFDPYSRSYSAGEDYWASKAFGKDIGGFVKNMQNKVGLGWLLEPKMNVHGEEVTNFTNFGSWVWNYLNQNIFPASWKVDNKNDIDDELVRLYGVVDNTSMFPTKPSRNVGSYTDSETRKSVPLKLTDDNEYMEYQRDYGQAIYSALEELMSSQQYQMMTDEEKSMAVENTIESAKKAIRNVWKAKLAERSMK